MKSHLQHTPHLNRDEFWEGVGGISAALKTPRLCMSKSRVGRWQAGEIWPDGSKTQMLNWVNWHLPAEIWIASCSRAWWHWKMRRNEYFLVYFPLEIRSKMLLLFYLLGGMEEQFCTHLHLSHQAKGLWLMPVGLCMAVASRGMGCISVWVSHF